MPKLPKLSELEQCPHCGYDEFYQKQSVKGFIYTRKRFDGEVADNTEMYNSLSYGELQKTVYCGECQEKIAIDDTK